jgi:hypothetical protein
VDGAPNPDEAPNLGAVEVAAPILLNSDPAPAALGVALVGAEEPPNAKVLDPAPAALPPNVVAVAVGAL